MECRPKKFNYTLRYACDKIRVKIRFNKRRTPDMQTALQLTNTLKEVFPDDPVKGDFALFGSDIKRK